MRIVFAGTPEFAKTQLEALLLAPFEVVAVYTQPDKPSGRGQHIVPSPVKTLALAHGIPVLQPKSLRTPEAEADFAKLNMDVLVVAAYGLILPRFFLTHPKYGAINVHASLLPRWRGASPIQQSILTGDNTTGITLMKMDEGLDTGGILIQRECPILPTDTSQTLHDKLASLGADMLKNDLAQIIHQDPAPQDPTFATHAPKITKEQSHCHWNKPAVEIERSIRAFQPWPFLHTKLGDELIRLWEAKVVPLNTPAKPGTILGHPEHNLLVATGDQGLIITKAQWPGKKPLPMPEILKSKEQLLAIGKQFDPI